MPLLTLLLACLALQPAHALTNLLANPSLEGRAGETAPASWDPEVHSAEGAVGTFTVDTAVKHSGASSQRIDHTSEGGWVRLSQEDIPARPDALYRLSVWVLSQGHFSVLAYEFRGSQPYVTVRVAEGGPTAGWQEVSKVFTTSRDAVSMKVSLIADGRGTVWFDDASLVEVSERPLIRAPHVAAGPPAEGNPDDPSWKRAPATEGFYGLGKGGEPAPVQTCARVLCDDQALFLLLDCAEPNVPGLVRKTHDEDEEVWGDDCVEVFLARPEDPAGTLHLGVGAGGGKWQERTAGKQWYRNWFSWFPAEGPEPKWQAAAQLRAGGWWAQLRLPYEALGGPPRPGTAWRLQLCRVRRAGGQEEDSTWSYTDGNKFAVPERFGSLIFSAPPGPPPALLKRPVDADTFEPLILPRPLQAQWDPGAFRFGPGTVILAEGARGERPAQRPEAELLQADLKARFGLSPEIVTALPAASDAQVISLSGAPDASAPPGEEAYRLRVLPRRIDLAARSPRGRLYGVETLRQMLARDDRGPFARCGVVTDAPALAWRGWHMSLPRAADLPACKRLVDVLALLKYNTLVWEVDGDLQYSTHPDLARESALTKAQLRELVDYCKLRRFEVIPQLATFSHFDYILRRPPYQALAESPRPTQGGHEALYNYCPCNPEVYRLVFDLMGEITEIFQPRYFHIGHDEASSDDIGTCPRCRGQEPWRLFAADVIKLDGWIKQHGMRTVMWGDQLLAQDNGGLPLDTAKATDLLPKDILIFDWHYEPNHAYDRTLTYFRQHGFQVVGCPWYEPVNAYAYALAARRVGALGYCGTTWEGVPGTALRMPHLPTAWVVGAEGAWGPGFVPLSALPYQPVAEFNRLWRLGERELPRRFRCLDLAGFCNERTVDTDRGDGWMGEGPQYDLRALPGGIQWVGGVPFRLAEGATAGARTCLMLADATTRPGLYPEAIYEIPVGRRTPALYFLHTCSVPPTRQRQLYAEHNPTLLGAYVVTYQDGRQEKIPLRYLANIHDWNGQRGPAQALGVWEGKTAGGALVSLGAVEWRNPRPEEPIRSLDFTSALSSARPVLLALTAAER